MTQLLFNFPELGGLPKCIIYEDFQKIYDKFIPESTINNIALMHCTIKYCECLRLLCKCGHIKTHHSSLNETVTWCCMEDCRCEEFKYQTLLGWIEKECSRRKV